MLMPGNFQQQYHEVAGRHLPAPDLPGERMRRQRWNSSSLFEIPHH